MKLQNTDNWTSGIALDFDHATSVVSLSFFSFYRPKYLSKLSVGFPLHTDYHHFGGTTRCLPSTARLQGKEGRPGPQIGSYVKANCHKEWKKIVGDGNDD